MSLSSTPSSNALNLSASAGLLPPTLSTPQPPSSVDSNGNRRRACEFCGKVCSSSSALLYHTRLHTGERPYVCDVCNKGFIQKVHLQRHMENNHGQSLNGSGLASQSGSRHHSTSSPITTSANHTIEFGNLPTMVPNSLASNNNNINNAFNPVSLASHTAATVFGNLSMPTVHGGMGSSSYAALGPALASLNAGGLMMPGNRLEQLASQLKNKAEMIPCLQCGDKFHNQMSMLEHMLIMHSDLMQQSMQQFQSQMAAAAAVQQPSLDIGAILNLQQILNAQTKNQMQIQQELLASPARLMSSLQGSSQQNMSLQPENYSLKNNNNNSSSNTNIVSNIITNTDNNNTMDNTAPISDTGSSNNNNSETDNNSNNNDEVKHDDDVLMQEAEELLSMEESMNDQDKMDGEDGKKSTSRAEPVTCPDCGNQYFGQIAFLEHVFEAHGRRLDEDAVATASTPNSLTPSSPPAASPHIVTNSHRRNTWCPHCKKHLSSPTALIVHLRAHSGMKPFTCNICQKSFMHQNSLKVHMLSHSGAKPHACPVCSKSFTTTRTLKIHMMIHTGERPYGCKFCGRRFIQQIHLLRHIKSHIRRGSSKDIGQDSQSTISVVNGYNDQAFDHSDQHHEHSSHHSDSTSDNQDTGNLVINLKTDETHSDPGAPKSQSNTSSSSGGGTWDWNVLSPNSEPASNKHHGTLHKQNALDESDGPIDSETAGIDQSCLNCQIVESELSLLRTEMVQLKQFLQNKLNTMESKVESIKRCCDANSSNQQNAQVMTENVSVTTEQTGTDQTSE